MSIARVLVPKGGLKCLVTAEERSRAETSRRAKEQDHPLWVWRNLPSTLVGADGSEFFNRHVRGTMLPLLRGTITDIQQDGGVLTLLVSVFGSGSTDATLRVDEPLGTEFARGVEVEFEGVPKSFRAQPFCLTLDVAREKLRTSGPH